MLTAAMKTRWPNPASARNRNKANTANATPVDRVAIASDEYLIKQRPHHQAEPAEHAALDRHQATGQQDNRQVFAQITAPQPSGQGF